MDNVKEPTMVSPEQLMAQQEMMDFQKRASRTELNIRRASTIMNGLAVGGDVINPLFDKKTRKELEEKLAGILKEI